MVRLIALTGKTGENYDQTSWEKPGRFLSKGEVT
jgi:hypothetical protein